MRRPGPSRPSRDRSEVASAFDRVTTVVFIGVLSITGAAFLSYGPEAACRHIAEVFAANASAAAALDASTWASAMER